MKPAERKSRLSESEENPKNRASAEQRAERLVDRLDVDVGQLARQLGAAELGQLRAAQLAAERTDEPDRVAGAAEAHAARPGRRRELADHADDRRRVDRALGALVVQRDI